MNNRTILILSLVWCALALAARGADYEAQTLDGQSVAGTLVQLDDKQLSLETPAGRQTLLLEKLASVIRQASAAATSKPAISVELVDNSVLNAVDYKVADQKAQITLAAGEVVELPTRSIRWVRFAGAVGDDKLNQQWTDVIGGEHAGDVLVVRKGEVLDHMEGVLGNISAETCQFELDKDVIPVKRAKVAGLIYFHNKAAELKAAVGIAVSDDGTRLSLAKVDLADGKLQVVTPTGLSRTIPLDNVARLDFSSGKIAYLSDLDAESAKHTPYFGAADLPASIAGYFHYRRDAGFEHEPLRIDGRVFRKGIAVHSRSTLVYKLPAQFRLFKATLGIDDNVREAGNAHVEVRGDDKVLWQGDVHGSDPPQELELELAGARRLTVFVDYGSDLDIGDQVDLGDARVTK